MNRLQPKSLTADHRLHPFPRALTHGCRHCTLPGSELCRVVRNEAQRTARQPRVRRYDPGMMIVEQGQPPSFLGVLRRGYIRQERLRLNGDHVLIGLAHPGDIIGGLPGVAATCASEASTPIEICAFDPGTVDHLMLESPSFRQVFLRETDRQHQHLLGSAWHLNALDSRERIIAFLVDATRIMPTEPQPDGSLILHVQVPRRDWADLTNTAVETISRTIKYLVETGVVVSLTPSSFRIRDLDRLARLAGVDAPERPRRGDRVYPAQHRRPSPAFS